MSATRQAESMPLVSIGMPFYNGEKHVAGALDMVLAQDYPNLEIVVSDNASTDRTAEICEAYAARDPRIRFHRNSENRGAIWNFNRVFELSNGKYFMWAAHDDKRAPSFVSKCVAVLEQNPDAVLCQSHVEFIVEGHDGVMCRANLDSFRDKKTPVSRFRQVLADTPATAIYGVLRTEAVKKTKRLMNGMSSDVAFMNELSIYGSFAQVEEPLFTYYQRANWNTVDADYRAFFGKDKKPWWYLPFLVLMFDQAKRIEAADLPLSLKVRLWSVLLEREVYNSAIKAIVKTTGRVCPDTYKETVGNKLYWRLLHTQNLEAEPTEIYVNRIIKPMLGWWR